MEEFVEFNAVKFLNASKAWAREKKALQQEMDSITELKGMENSPVRSGKISDSVASVAIARERIEKEISRIEDYETALTNSLNNLTEDEFNVIQLFFFSRGNIAPLIRKFGETYGFSQAGTYRLRRIALDHLTEIITAKYLS